MDQLPAWTHADDVRALLEAVDKQEVKALSPGLGLGTVQPHGRKPKLGARTPFSSPAESGAVPSPMRSTPLPPPQFRTPVGAPARPAATARGRQRSAVPAPVATAKGVNLPKRLFAYALDFLLVLGSLAVAMGGMVALHAARGGGEPWLEQKPVQWLIKTSPLITLALVYATFVVYGLLFKVVVGRTCGETLLQVQPRRAGRRTGV